MTTYTLRAPEDLLERLNSAGMRQWLRDFLNEPHALPRDPGPGHGRISLTLPENAIAALVAHCQCGVSAALRRVEIERVVLSRPAIRDASQIPTVSKDNRIQGGEIAILLIFTVILSLAIGIWLIWRFRKNQGSKR